MITLTQQGVQKSTHSYFHKSFKRDIIKFILHAWLQFLIIYCLQQKVILAKRKNPINVPWSKSYWSLLNQTLLHRPYTCFVLDLWSLEFISYAFCEWWFWRRAQDMIYIAQEVLHTSTASVMLVCSILHNKKVDLEKSRTILSNFKKSPSILWFGSSVSCQNRLHFTSECQFYHNFNFHVGFIIVCCSWRSGDRPLLVTQMPLWSTDPLLLTPHSVHSCSCRAPISCSLCIPHGRFPWPTALLKNKSGSKIGLGHQYCGVWHKNVTGWMMGRRNRLGNHWCEW